MSAWRRGISAFGANHWHARPPSLFVNCLRVRSCFLAVLMALAVPVFAQPTGDAANADCAPQMAAIEQAMEAARAKGQMLRRRELAEELSALQARCAAGPAAQGHAASIDKLEQEIRDLRSKLEQAEAQLRKLKSAGS